MKDLLVMVRVSQEKKALRCERVAYSGNWCYSERKMSVSLAEPLHLFECVGHGEPEHLG